MTIPGVGVQTSAAFAAAIDEVGRFRQSRTAGAYFGLVPIRHQSGEIDWTGRITKQGDSMVPRQQQPLYVLPPRSPELNGAVERCNGSWRYEFYAAVDLPANIDRIAEHVDAFQHLYSYHRPHGALDGRTPNEYLPICRDRSTQRSYMS